MVGRGGDGSLSLWQSRGTPTSSSSRCDKVTAEPGSSAKKVLGAAMKTRATLTLLVVGVAFPFLAARDSYAQAVESAQPMAAGNPQRTGFSERAGPLTEPEILWEAAPGLSGGGVTVQAIIDEKGNLYVNCAFGGGDHILSLTPKGKERWRYSRAARRDGLSIPVLVRKGRLISGFRDSYVGALSRTSGELQWETSTSMSSYGVLASPVTDRKGSVYIGGSVEGDFFKIDPNNGDVVWTSSFERSQVTSSPALSRDEKTVYFGGGFRSRGEGYVHALSTSNGTFKWTFAFPNADFSWCSPIVGRDGTIYIQESRHGFLFALTDQGGSPKQKWLFDPLLPGDAPRFPAMDKDTIYLSTVGADPRLIAVNLKGKEKWRRAFYGIKGEMSSPIVNKDAVYISLCDDGGVYCLSLKDGATIWRKQVVPKGGLFAEAMTLGDDGILYVGTNGTFEHPDQAVMVALKATKAKGEGGDEDE